MTDLLGGQVQVLFGSTSLTIEQIRAGKLRPLAVTTTTRWEGLLDIPTVDDFVSGYEASAWAGFGAPKNTPTEIVEKLNKEINAGLADPKMKMTPANRTNRTIMLMATEPQIILRLGLCHGSMLAMGPMASDCHAQPTSAPN
jgi:tripartite-type tricarboxylate transporter receptor subunit TctC